MSLLKLSSEPLQLITQELAIWELAALVCTCEEARRILKTTESVAKATMLSSVPMERPNRLITTFRFLLEVSIGDGGSIPLISPGHIIYLPSTVISLKLNFIGAFRCFQRGFKAWKPVFPIDPFTKLSVVQIKESLPNLRTLKVISEETEDPHFLIPGLPTSLTCLQLHKNRFGSHFSIYSACMFECPHELPPNLVTLKLPRCKQFTANASLERLVHLQTLLLHSCTEVPLLPPSITKLRLKGVPKDYKLADQLPDLLSLRLDCEMLPSDFEFPKHLTSFKLRSGLMEMSSSQSVFPSTITRLCLGDIVVDKTILSRPGPYGSVLPKVNIVWPPTLKHLDFLALAEISQLRSLPPTLERTLLTIRDVTLANVGMLPKHLTKLTIPNHVINEARGMESFDLASMMPNLKDFSIKVEGRGPLKIVLPRTLVKLYVNSITSPPENVEDTEMSFLEMQKDIWPPFLRSLTVNESSTPTADLGLMHLPRTLTSFNLVFSSEKIRFTHVGLSHLPDTITDLHIQGHIESVLPDWLHQLPSCLRSIRLKYYDGMRDEHVASLPRCVHEIELDNSLQLTDACLPFLPPSLTSLKMRRNRHLTPKILDYVPRQPWMKFTLQLPKNVNFPKRLKKSIPSSVDIYTHKLRTTHTEDDFQI